MKNIIFIAPPAAGKGTISDYLVENCGYTHISTGDILRNMAKSDTDLGKSIAKLMEEGKFIGDDIILPAFKESLQTILGKPFILDGMPRNVQQADYLENLLKELNVENYIVINIEIAKEILEKRISGRRSCENCKSVYNIYFEGFKPKVENICDKCNGKLIGREDDSLETYQTRYQEYMEQTSPLINYYKEKGLLVTIDGTKPNNEIIKDVLKIIEGE